MALQPSKSIEEDDAWLEVDQVTESAKDYTIFWYDK